MMRSNLIVVAVVAAVIGTVMFVAAAHENDHFSAGAPGDPKGPARIIKVTMREDGKKMLFEPSRLSVRKGEQIRFVLSNDGTESHEFVLATISENRNHAEMMKKHPHMKHEEPNAIRLTPFTEGEMIWKFNRRGTFEYACLIDGHYEAGMHGTVDVK
jgi:uncharacterized cupredoxin-like copper-binding protein